MTFPWKALCVLVLLSTCSSLCATTWYVRRDGGTRYSTRMLSGQCDGRADKPYPGTGTNRACAFNDVRLLWQDGSYTTTSDASSFPAYGWIGAGGDIYLIRGSLRDGVSYRVGWNSASGALDNASKMYWGIQGDPYASGAPPPPSGSEGAPTRILGENFAACHDASAKTQLHGGYGVAAVFNMRGSSHVEIACIDVTDFSACGTSGQRNGCNREVGKLSDYASNGVAWSNASTHDVLADVHIHGMAAAGMVGPTGDGTVFRDLDLLGNAAAGWNADAGDGKTGSGSLLVQHFQIGWNGCAEEYPVTHPAPYQDCTDDNASGYGDGFGTATVDSSPGWQVRFDQGSVYNNTQDGLDALHLTGAGSSMTVTHTLAYGNMGQQLKVGGSSGTMTDNVIYTNCNALRQKIPGTPEGFNAHLSDFCRAADAGIKITVNDGSTTVFERNIVYSASATALEVDVNAVCAAETCLIRQQNNVFVGFRNNAANGYPSGGTGDYSNPIYAQDATKAYRNAGSRFDHNTTFHAKKNWPCPARDLHETHAVCEDPHLVDETWHLFGFGDTKPTGVVSPSGTDKEQKQRAPAKPLAYRYLGGAVLVSLAARGFVLLRKRLNA